MNGHPTKAYPTLGCCGLDCGLCPRYYTVGGSRCPGCCGPDFFSKHPSCPFITCCVKKKQLEVCAQCDDFPCSRFDPLMADSQDVYDSFVTYGKAVPNLHFIRTHGIEKFMEQQRKRIGLLEEMLKDFDDGRSRSFYCIATTLLPINDLEASLIETERRIKAGNVGLDDTRTRSSLLREFLDDCAAREGIALRLRKKG
ncbi:MAG: DUF3795 domain-containing protein, partial [Dehalococcoidia bacterium]|nr:DUF3795 domain-containing protein [Dehalococcoidia bacterium]